MHYKDGTEAKVGDLVKGTVYNTKGVIVGTMLGITPGSSACNCRVGLLQVQAVGKLHLPSGDAQGTPHVGAIVSHDGIRVIHREGSGDDLKVTALAMKVDYSQCDHLELVHRPDA